MSTTLVPSAAVAGFALGASLIVAIGAQNAFVLRQGLRREYVLVVVALCAFIDAALITVGVAGFGRVLAGFPAALDVAALLGALFLAYQGARAFRSALRPHTLTATDAPGAGPTLHSIVVATLAVSLLNPHVYLDTVMLLGSVAAQYPVAERTSFAMGAVSASFTWFFSLGFGARLLSPLFSRPAAWRVLDLLIAFVMWWVAAKLALGLLG
ncbi:MAG TPA: LysE/ArgO family amino acid transporter [Coriobacteriia bacterium]|nr:LysE/ArgO family amino acid transporter [Coriobacteriia bacterium]